jgi:trimeric autotransporter adhesin
MNTKYKTLLGFAALIVASGVPASLYATPQQATATISHAGAEPAQASVPRLIQFNGTLKDATTHPVSGVASVTFAIYSEQDGGSPLWSETQNVLADALGHYNVLLGSATSTGVPADLFGTGQSRWLGITIARQQEMPRALMASVPYAMKAGDADTLGGLPASAYVTTQSLSSHPLAGGAATTIVASPQIASSSPAANADAQSTTQSVTQATVTGTGTANFLPIWTSGTNLGVSKIFQANGGFVGINTNTPLLQLDVNGNSIFRGSFQIAPQGTATASTGQPSHSFQWQASLFNSSSHAAVTEAFGFRSVPATNNTSNPTAKLDLFYGPGGGTLNDTGLSISNNGIITFASGQSFSGSELQLPNTTSSTAGVLTVGGQSFLNDFGSTSNAFVGNSAGGGFHSTGAFNTGVGTDALFANASGFNNTALGFDSLDSNNTGSSNTAAGAYSLLLNTSGANNSAFGEGALGDTNVGSNNTAIGLNAGETNTNGSSNTFVGANADSIQLGLTNAAAIGANAKVNVSNAMILGGTGSSAVHVGVNTISPTHTMDIIDAGFNGSALAVESTVVNDDAVFGANFATSGSSNGALFQTSSAAGSGVVAVNQAGGLAAFFSGNVAITGTLTKGGGSFKIDDPIDPANKYLSHSFVESPDMMNIYNGSVVLDAKGEAAVTMPAWFDALNQDFQYQLTSVGGPGPGLYIAEEVSDNHFKIAGGKPGLKVSWQVTGVRHDAWANAHRIPNEELKPANEQGYYLNPELFGAPESKSILAADHSSKHAAPQPGEPSAPRATGNK